MKQHTESEAIWHGTTILAVRKSGKLAMLSDGQVSMGQTIMKGNARKVRRIAGGEILAGFAGATADAFTLFELISASARTPTSHSRRSTFNRLSFSSDADLMAKQFRNI